MKNLIVILLTLHCSLFTLHSTAQWGSSCLPEGIYFDNQEDIDRFQVNYPGCVEIEGDVSISGNITNLNGLSVLTYIGGDLFIMYSEALSSLNGLDNVTSIGGDLFIAINYNLASLNGLDNVTSIGGSLVLHANPLSSLTGLDNVDSIGGNIHITENYSLSTCAVQILCDYLANPNGAVNIYNNAPGCSNPTEVAASCGITLSCLPFGNYYFTSQADIDNFQPDFPGCTELEGNVTIQGSDITNLDGLNVVTSIGGGLIIGYTESLTSLNGLDNVTSIGGDLEIRSNSSLTSLTGLENVTSIGGDLKITNNYYLSNLAGLDNLTSIEGDIHINNNDALASLTGLDNVDAGSITHLNIFDNQSLSTCEVQSVCDFLASPNGIIKIYNNAPGCNNPGEIATSCGFTMPCLPFGNYYFSSQADIDNFQSDFPDCLVLEGNVTIQGNDITNLDGLSLVTSIGGGLSINNNDSLTSLTRLDNLTSIGGGLEIRSNSSLTSLTGLENVTFIGRDLEIRSNFSLTSLTGLENVTSIGGDLDINNNYSLTCLTGLENVTSIGGNLYINYNILTSLTGLDNVISIGGDLDIGGNDSLTSLVGLDNLTTIGGNLNIRYSILTSLTGLEGLTSIGGDLYINNNNALTSLTGLDNIDAASIRHLNIYNNLSLSTCEVQSVCNYLANPNGIIEIYGNSSGCNSTPEIAANCGITLPCLPYGNYYFFSQAEIDSFQSDFPDCTEIEGDVYISGSDITNLDGLNEVISIGGDLEIKSNGSLTSLTGLDNVTSIGCNLYINYNNDLTSLTGLDNVISIGGDLDIGGNDSLTSLVGLDNVTSIEGGLLNISGNDALTSLTGLDNVTSIGGTLEISNNGSLTSITGLINTNSIGGHLWLTNNPLITSLTGLENVTSIGGTLNISSTSVLTSLTGFEGLTSIGGGVNMNNNDALASFAGLDNVTAIGGVLYINNNDALSSLTGLDNIDAASIRHLHINDNLSLSTCEVQSICDYLASPNGIIEIYNNAPGCNNPGEIANSCGFTMPCLPFGNYYFSSQADIDNFPTDFPGCTDLEGSVNISGSDITNLDGINVVISIGRGLVITENNSLQNLAGLENLTGIGAQLWIAYNDNLTSLSGIENLDAGTIGYLAIAGNPSLSGCDVQSICNYLLGPGGSVEIYDNAPGCNSQVEVEVACAVGVEESIVDSRQSIVRVYPNPSGDIFNFEFIIFNSQRLILKIYDLFGREVAVLLERDYLPGEHLVQFDASALPAGIYFCVLKTDHEIQTIKMIKL